MDDCGRLCDSPGGPSVLRMETEIEMRTMALGHGTAQFDKKLNLWQRGLRNEIATSQGKFLACDQTCVMRDKYSMRVLRYAGARARELGKDRKAIYLTRGVLKICYPMQG